MRSPHVRGAVRPRYACATIVATALAIAIGGAPAAQQVVPGSNVNMVSGTTFPTGDPFLQRQNEPSLAVSTRNPLHLLAGANDYRTVDLPGPFEPLRGEKMNADAWVGLFKSFDGGRTWQSTLVPGFPQDGTDEGMASPIKGRQAATDPVVRAGTNGLFYYAGLAFDRGVNAPSTIFVARFIDQNNREDGDPIEYLGTSIVDADTGTRFLDKTALAVDVPRGAATCAVPVRLPDGSVESQTIPAGNVYVAYSAFTGSDTSQQSQILFSRSTDCGSTWSAPKNLSIGNILNQNAQIAINPTNGHIWVSWRRFKSGSLQSDGIFIVRSVDGGLTFSRAVRVAPLSPFDQGTSTTSFRTNAFQTMAVDASGRVYVAWPERGHAVLRPDRVTGDARIVVSSSATGSGWTTPAAIETQGLGHQLMPTLTFHGGKLRLIYYDLREDVSQIFGPFVDELPILTAPDPKPPRHTIDVYVAQATPGANPVFTSARLSDYAFGTFAGSTAIQQLQYNPPNLPLFRQGEVPFMGDYIDLASSPSFVQGSDGVWRFNTQPTGSAVSHGVWTDNRDVRPPIDGRWDNYTPVMSESLGTTSLFDPTQPVPPCTVGQTGMRNQNIYTAKVTEGLFVGSPGNAKPLGSIQRAFVITVENATATTRSYRLQILNQPPSGQASFQQFTAATAPLTLLDASVAPFSTIARSVFVTSSDTFARVEVSVAEIAAPGAPAPLPGGQSGTVVLNGDPTNPSIQNPSIQNPSIQNAEEYNPAITTAFLAPSIQNPSIQNPSIQNPSIQNPSIQNPQLTNDAIANPSIIDPSIQNPSIQNPSIQNPSIQNPSIQNQDLVNGSIQDTSWQITNDGNTTASYAIKLLTNGTLPTGFKSQLVLHKTYKTPSAQDCRLADQPHTVLIANIPDPAFTDVTDPSIQNPSIQNPSIQNATISLAPGESANVTLRIVDPNRFDGVEFDAGAAIAPAAVAQSVNTEDAAQGSTTPPIAIPMTITTAALAGGSPGGAYSASLSTFASAGGTTWTVTQGALPPGVTLDPTTGQLSGTPTTPGNYVFTVSAVDGSGNVDVQTLAIKIDPVTPPGFSRIWNGADNNWNNPKNWSPAGVPTTTDDVYVSASIPVVPTLTSDVTINSIVVESGATVDTNGFTLTLLGNADGGNTIVGAGTVAMVGSGRTITGTFPNLTITGSITAIGPVSATGNLTLAPGASLNLNGFASTVGGQLVTNAGSASAPLIVGAGFGEGTTLTVGGLDVDGLTLDRVILVVGGGLLSQFDDVRFVNYEPEDVYVTIDNPGAATPFAMSGLSFFAVPTTGRYIQANDTSADANPLVVNVSASLPGDGSSRSATQGGAVINWLFDPNTASVGVTQTASPNPAVVGAPLTYSILVANGGPATATNVQLSNPLPAGTSFQSATTSQGTCSFTSGLVVSCDIGNIAPLSAVSVTVVVIPGAAGALNNAVSVTASESDPATSDNSQTVTTPVFATGAAADLSIAKSDSADPVPSGSAFTYSLLVSNAGPSTATNVVVTDAVPAGVTPTGASSTFGTCNVIGQIVTCQIGSLLAGANATVTINATAASFGIATNTANVVAAEGDPNVANNTASETTVVGAAEGCVAATFRGPDLYGGPAGPATQVQLADMDGDGDLDIVTTLQGPANGVSVLPNNGEGTYGPSIFSFLSAPAFSGKIADFNGDGDLDMVVGVGGTPNTLRVLLGNGTGTLTQSGDPIPISSGFSVEALDADGDGDQDVIARGTTNELVLLKNSGAGAFAPPVSVYATAVGLRSATGDFDGDGDADIALARTDANFAVLLNDGSGTFTATTFGTAAAPRGIVALGDLNGDGAIDLGIAEGNSVQGTSRLTLRLGAGNGSFGPEVDVSPGNTGNVPTSADVNGDGKLDLIVNHAVRTAVSVQLGDGAGGFGAPAYFVTTAFSNPAVGDVDGDGKPDITSGDEDGVLGILLSNCGRPTTDLGVTVTESADPVNENDEVVYTVTVSNTSGNTANNVQVATVILTAANSTTPPNTTVTSTTTGAGGTFDGDPSDGVYFWQFPTVAADSSFTIEFRVRALAGGTVSLTSGVTSDDADTDTTNNTAFEATTITPTGRDIVVTNTNDGGPGSLRQAIIESNGDAGDVDRIVFAIPGAGVHTIVPLGALPTITQPATIDGTTQAGFVDKPVIELNGAGLAANGLLITGGGTTVRGLAINRFSNSGIRIATNGGNVIAGNFIGTDPTGTSDLGNGSGIFVGSAGNTIGGTASSRNLVSGNTGNGIRIEGTGTINNVVQGNYIGIDATGIVALPNSTGISVVVGPNTIGGTTAGAGNLIAGNTFNGIVITGAAATGVIVQRNVIGLNAAGNALSNGTGIQLGAPGNTIGGTTGNAGNVISGNAFGIVIGGAVSTANTIAGNFIGTDAAGSVARGNGPGIQILNGASGNTIGGTAAGARNIISGNAVGVEIADPATTGNLIQGNYIGTNVAGSGAIANVQGVTIRDAAGNTLGGSTGGERNVISGNTSTGVDIFGVGSTNNVVRGNLIGTDAAGAAAVPNGSDGIAIRNTATNNAIGGTGTGQGNTVAFNGGAGVRVTFGTGNAILGNLVFANTGLGIDHASLGVTPNDAGDPDTGANNLQNFPVLTSAITAGGTTAVAGTLNSTANTAFRLEFFSNAACDASGNGEGQTFVGTINVTTDGSGNASFTTEVPASTVLSATATDPTGNTSEFSQCRTATAGPQTFTVTNTFDSGPGSLRAAILNANASTGTLDTIAFTIGAGVQTIAPTSSLPVITDPVIIDATTQPGYAGTPLIELNGANAGGSSNGLHVTAGSTTIRGLAIYSFGRNGSGSGGAGIALVTNGGNIVEGNYIGLDATGTGTTATPNRTDGVWMNGPNNRIGGTATAQRNVISGNTRYGVVVTTAAATGNLVQGNYIGTNAAGSGAAANGNGGVIIDAPANTVGGTAAGAGNVISGNGAYGIHLSGGATQNIVQGNLIGTNAAGTSAIPNGLSGVGVTGASNNNTIGGAAGAARNVLSGNASAGVFMADSNGNLVRGNYIGTDITGASALANNVGVIMDGSGNVVGGATAAEGNVIAFNTGTGVWSTSEGPNSVLGNSIHSNGGLGIDLGQTLGLTPNDAGDGDIGANGLQNFPVITAAIAGDNSTTIQGTLNSQPNATYRLEFFSNTTCDASGNGEGQTFVGTTNILTNGDGLANFSVTVGPAGNVTATATDSLGNTSEFSACVTVTGLDALLIFPNRGLNALQMFDPASRTIVRTIPIPAPYSYTAGGTMLSTALVRPDGTIFTNVRNGSGAATALKVSSSTGEALAAQISGGDFLQQIAFDPVDPNRETVIGGTPFLTEVRAVNPAAETSTTRITRTGANFIGIVTAANGDIYAATFCGPDNGAVLRYDSTGTLIGVFAQVGTATGSCEVNALARDDTGNLYVAQNNSNRLAKFDNTGTFTGFITAPSFANPAQVFFNTDDGLLYVGNSADERLTILTPQGAPVAVVRMGGVGVGVPGALDGSNAPPIADAGPDQNIPVGSTVQLDGSGSSDPEDQVLTYTWILNTKPAGSTAVLSATNIVNPTFVADKPGTYIAQLVVNDGFINSPSDTVTITTENQAPVANAGADQSNLAIGATVNLDGSASNDPDGQSITYSWSFVSKPSTSAATIFNATTVTPSFVADAPGLYRLQLVVNDGQTSSTPDTVDIATVNQTPVANAGSDQNVLIGSTVQLNGGQSNDPDENPLTYAWTLPTRPAGSTAALVNPTTAVPTFVPDVTGTYVARLVVNDGFVNSAPDDVTITAATNNISMALVGTPLVGVGRQATLEVTLPTPAPAGGAVVTVVSSDTNVLTVGPPNAVTIPEGGTTGQLTLNGITASNPSDPPILTASSPGYNSGTFSVAVTNNVLTTPATLNVPFSQTASFPVSIPQAAPAGGIAVSIVSSNDQIIEVLTPTVTIPEGALSVNGTVRGLGIGTATVTATNAAFSTSASQVSSTGSVTIVETSVSIRPGFPRTITVQLQSGGSPVAAPAGGVSITLTPADSGCLAATSPITIAQGLVSATSTLSYGGTTTLPCTTTLTAAATSLTADTLDVTVNPPPGVTLFSLPATIGGGLQNGPFTVRLGESNHGGTNVTLTSSNGAIMQLTPNGSTQANPDPNSNSITLFIPNGQTDATYFVHGMSPTALGTASIDATATNFTSASGTVNIIKPAVVLTGVPTTTTTLSANSLFFVQLGVANAGNTFLSDTQAVRFGTSAQFTVANSNGSAAQLVTSAGSDPAQRTVTITGGNAFSASTVATGGIAVDPQGEGATTITVSASDFNTLPGSTASVTVSAPGITLFSLPATVGGGLQSGAFTVRLGASNHGGTNVTLTSSNGAIMQLTPNGSTQANPDPNSNSITLFIPNGQTDATYFIHGMSPAALGTATITATATNFTSSSGTVNIVPPTVVLNGVPTTTTTLSANSLFFVQLGVANAGNTFLSDTQAVRFGTSAQFTVTNSNGSAAQLVTSAGSDPAQRTVTITGGNAFSGGTVATGGIAVDPQGEGATTITVSAPGFNTIPSSTASVTVSAPGITLFSLPARVGGGLQSGAFTVRLGASNHGGTNVTLTSSNGAIMQLTPNGSTQANPDPNSNSITLFVPNGQTDATYFIHGMSPAALGTATITATATNFTSSSGTVNIVPPTVVLNSVPTTTTTLSTDSLFFVQLGVANAGNTFLSDTQAVRFGTSAQFTVTNSNGSVAQLRTIQGVDTASRVVTITGGTAFSGSTLVSGGIAFDPIGGGSTTVSVTAQDFNTLPASAVNVTVSAPGITLFSMPATVGGGLQSGPFTVRLGASNHGGVSVRLSSSNRAVMKLSPNGTTAVDPNDPINFIDIFVPSGQTDATYFIHGISPGVTGTVTITASAPGFTDAQAAVNIVQPAVALISVPTNITTLSADTLFFVQLGVANAGNTFLNDTQAVRFGTSLNATVMNTNGTVAHLVTSAGSDPASRTVTIPGGSAFSASTVVSGGIALDPRTEGTTTVSVSAAGFKTISSSTSVVTVTAPGITLFSTPTTVGGGLQNGPYTVRLGASGHGGVFVRLASSNTSIMKLSPNGTTAVNPGDPSNFIDIFIPNGQTDATYFIHGIAPTALGTATITASVAGFTTTNGSVTIEQPAIQIQGLPASIDAAAATDPFIVVAGLASADNTFLRNVQSVRTGTSVLVTLNLTQSPPTPLVAQLLTSSGGDQSRTVSIPGGESSSPSTVAAGGVAFDPLQAGTTTVTAEASDFIVIPANGVQVQVTSSLVGGSSTTKGKGKKGGG